MDNDMLGAILRSATTIEVSDETLSVDAIAEAVHGEGHFLRHAATYARINSDFLYPDIADRRSVEEWTAAGQPDLVNVAHERARTMLKTYAPKDAAALARLENNLKLRLTEPGVLLR